MQPLAAELSSEDIRRLADYYAKLPSLKPRTDSADKSLLERGERLATTGDAANGVPACNACHGREALATYPRLAGQSPAYMAGQLRLWGAGHHAATGGGAIMAPIAQRLSDHDIAAVTAYLASLCARPAARAGHDGNRPIAACRHGRATLRWLRRPSVRSQSKRTRGAPACAAELVSVRFCMLVLLIVVIAAATAIRGPASARALLASPRAVVWAGIVFPAITLTGLLACGVWLTRARGHPC